MAQIEVGCIRQFLRIQHCLPQVQIRKGALFILIILIYNFISTNLFSLEVLIVSILVYIQQNIQEE